MKIIPSASTPEIANAGARQDAAYAQQWRRALEEAQWQARQRIAPSGPAAADSGAGVASAPAGTAPPAAAGQEPWATPLGPARDMTPVARTAALAQAVARALQPTPVAHRTAGVQVTAGAAFGEPRIAATPGRPAAAAAPAVTAVWHELPEWPAVLVHASVQGNRISVGMRDGALHEEDLPELFYRLRAQLRAAGLELASLTVNGHNVAPADDAAARGA